MGTLLFTLKMET